MTSFALGILLLLLAPMLVVGIAFTWWRAKKKPLMAAIVGAILAFMYLGYVVGRSDGEGAYFHRFRTEMNPFLRDLRMVSAAKREVAISDFLIRADDGKLMPEDYLKDLKAARQLLDKEPNQLPATVFTREAEPANLLKK